MARGCFQHTHSGAALEALTALVFIAVPIRAVRQGAAPTVPRWERVRGLPRMSFYSRRFGEPWNPEDDFPSLAIDGPSGVGLLSGYADFGGAGGQAVFYTSDAGRTWKNISSYYINGIWMAGSQAAFGVGQLAPEYDTSKPTALLRWTQDKGWAVSLSLPKNSKAAGIEVQRVAVTNGGRTAFVLGRLLWKREYYLGPEGPDGMYTQRVWRYSAATDSWAVIWEDRSATAWKGKANLLGASGDTAWLSFHDTGDIDYYDGHAWKAVRTSPSAAGYVTRLHALAPGRALIELSCDGPSVGEHGVEVWHFDGREWTQKMYMRQDSCIATSSAAGPGFAELTTLHGCADSAARLWRWDGSPRRFSNDANFTTVGLDAIRPVHHHIVRAASSKAAVLANCVAQPDGYGRLETKVWRGAGWKDVRPIPDLFDCKPHALVPLPSGGAVIGLQGAGVWRLVW